MKRGYTKRPIIEGLTDDMIKFLLNAEGFMEIFNIRLKKVSFCLIQPSGVSYVLLVIWKNSSF